MYFMMDYHGLSWIHHGLSWIIPYILENHDIYIFSDHPSVPPGSHTPPPRRSASTGSSSNVARSHGRWRDARNPGSGTWKRGEHVENLLENGGKNLRKRWTTWNFEEDLVVSAMILLDFLLLSIFHRGKTMVLNRNRGFFAAKFFGFHQQKSGSIMQHLTYKQLNVCNISLYLYEFTELGPPR